ncbi:hypothetical protein [Erythrobacter mangrovi]|uniref:Uncharacterized protein n=1 Tax=Erythrobacter mangrovi TaxID=2739433 RepID=A0A7D4BSV7_9SPHN|nr:hypothetical protein [Erythrobacter mangrovi]QKG70227.1 hypothetical protein HQR01_01920 [Erythrobacter mangrovi]
MVHETHRRRGQPIIFLGSLFVGWAVLRVLVWEPPQPASANPLDVSGTAKDASLPIRTAETKLGQVSVRLSSPAGLRPSRRDVRQWESDPRATHIPTLEPPPHSPKEEARQPFGSHILGEPGIAMLPAPKTFADSPGTVGPDPAIRVQLAGPARQAGAKRWRIDAWLVLRRDSETLGTSGDRPASYGASQAGAVLSYRLAPATRLEPAAYVRTSKALVTNGESEGAVGIRVRPFANVPAYAHAEVRAVDSGGAVELRPATFVSSGLSDVPLGLGFEGEGYVQAGYVAGDFATGFVDGRVTAVHSVVRGETASLGAGFGVWGGAQRGSERLDFGPSLQVAFRLGHVPARIAADYRIRVAGNARPDTGVAITLSTGF